MERYASRGKLVTSADLDGIAYVSGLRLSPDAARIAFVQQGGVWVADARRGATPTRVASGTGPVWGIQVSVPPAVIAALVGG